jgi:hypothetical protein
MVLSGRINPPIRVDGMAGTTQADPHVPIHGISPTRILAGQQLVPTSWARLRPRLRTHVPTRGSVLLARVQRAPAHESGTSVLSPPQHRTMHPLIFTAAPDWLTLMFTFIGIAASEMRRQRHGQPAPVPRSQWSGTGPTRARRRLVRARRRAGVPAAAKGLSGLLPQCTQAA